MGGDAARAERAALPRVVWVLAAGSFVNSCGSFVVPFLVLYLVHRGYGTGLAAWAVSCYAAGKIAAGPTGGVATDRLGPRAVTAASMVGSAVATVMLAVVNGPGPVLATAAVTGLVSQLYRPATSAILAGEVPGPQRVKAFGVYQFGVSAGTAAGPAAGGLIAEHSFMILFILDAATSLAWAILAWRALPGSRASAGGTCSQPQAAHSLLGDRRLVRLLAVTVLANLVLFQAQTTLPLWVHRQGLSTAGYGLLLALNSGLILALQLPAARLASRWRPQPVIAVTSVIIGAGFGLLALAHTAALLAVAVTVWSLGELAQWPVAAAYTTSLAPPRMTGRYAGTRSLGYGTALLLAPLAGATLYHVSPALLWSACAAVGVCAAAVITPAPARLQLQTQPLRHFRRPGSPRAAPTSLAPHHRPHPAATTVMEEIPMSMPAASLQPYVRQATEHQRLAYTGGAELAVILDAAITGGQLTVIDTHSRRGDASPVHVHHHDDEAFLLLDGQMTVWVGEQRHILRSGGIAFLPRNIPHAVRCDIASRALVLCTPAGHQEAIFRAAGWDLTKPVPEGWQPTQGAIRDAAEQAGNTVLGPPHGIDD